MQIQSVKTHVLAYAYPGSENAKITGFASQGCYTLQVGKQQYGFATKDLALHEIARLKTTPDRWSIDHYLNSNWAGHIPKKYVLKQDIHMPNDPVWGVRAGKIIPIGTVFYRCEEGSYRPWFHNGPECLALSEADFVTE
jgi:hypothetical protein